MWCINRGYLCLYCLHTKENICQQTPMQVMDETAITLCKENSIPVVVFNITTPGNIMRAIMGDKSLGTTVDMQAE